MRVRATVLSTPAKDHCFRGTGVYCEGLPRGASTTERSGPTLPSHSAVGEGLGIRGKASAREAMGSKAEDEREGEEESRYHHGSRLPAKKRLRH